MVVVVSVCICVVRFLSVFVDNEDIVELRDAVCDVVFVVSGNSEGKFVVFTGRFVVITSGFVRDVVCNVICDVCVFVCDVVCGNSFVVSCSDVATDVNGKLVVVSCRVVVLKGSLMFCVVLPVDCTVVIRNGVVVEGVFVSVVGVVVVDDVCCVDVVCNVVVVCVEYVVAGVVGIEVVVGVGVVENNVFCEIFVTGFRDTVDVATVVVALGTLCAAVVCVTTPLTSLGDVPWV